MIPGWVVSACHPLLGFRVKFDKVVDDVRCRQYLGDKNNLTCIKKLLIMPPTLKKWGGILVSACPYVCMYVCIHVRDIVLKLHVWIPHGKIADAYFWFSLNYLPLSNYGPLTNKGMKFCKCRISKSIIARNLKLVSADRG